MNVSIWCLSYLIKKQQQVLLAVVNYLLQLFEFCNALLKSLPYSTILKFRKSIYFYHNNLHNVTKDHNARKINY